MRCLLMCFLMAPLLWAQSRPIAARNETVWEAGRPVLSAWEAPGYGIGAHLEHPTWGRLDVPKAHWDMDSLRLWKGVAWAQGPHHHPAHTRFRATLGGRDRFGDRVIYRCTDGRTWQVHARYRGGHPHPASGPYRLAGGFVALDDGSFLAWGDFKEGEAKGPLARFRVGAAQTLVFERLVPLPRGWMERIPKRSSLLQDFHWFGAGWSAAMVARSSEGILLVHPGSSLAVLLDNVDGHVRRLDVLFPGHLWEAEAWPRAILDVQPRADGSFLLVTPDLGFVKDRPVRTWAEWKAAETDPGARSRQLALGRLYREPGIRNVPKEVQALHWYRYTPEGPGLEPLPPPQGFPTRVISHPAYHGFSFTFRPDGGLVLGPGLEARGTVVR